LKLVDAIASIAIALAGFGVQCFLWSAAELREAPCGAGRALRPAGSVDAHSRGGTNMSDVSQGQGQGPLAGQKAIVTGASSGIGRAVAIALGGAGADVAVNHRNDESAALDVVREIARKGGRAIAIRADVSREDEVQDLFRRAVEHFGTIDILINNAGLQRDAPIEQMTLEQWNTVIAVNLTGQFLCAREAVREFKRRGVVPAVSRAAGKIICISSVHEVIPWAGHVNYAASKGGVMLMMKTIAQEVAPYRIRVNSISPGAVRTPINTAAWSTPEAYESLLKLIPYKRIGEPEDIGNAAVWLASDASDYVNGVSLYIDGGMTLYPEFASGG
jgi:glucose 1-dehydrogenase